MEFSFLHLIFLFLKNRSRGVYFKKSNRKKGGKQINPIKSAIDVKKELFTSRYTPCTSAIGVLNRFPTTD